MKNADIVTCIGNTDNRLTQQAWVDYVQRVDEELKKCELFRHFFGGSGSFVKWQNAAWISVVPGEDIEQLKQKLTHIRKDYMQDAVFVLTGDGELV